MKKPFVTAAQLEDIAARYPTPFHLYDEQGIRENARRLKAAFSWNPGYREYFAVKATPTPAILKILQEDVYQPLRRRGHPVPAGGAGKRHRRHR